MGIHITEKHSGKMSGMQSISTSCLCNVFCFNRMRLTAEYADLTVKKAQKREDKNISICWLCFAHTMLKYQTKMQPCLEKNTEVLTSEILDDSSLPVINACYFRFEAFGDLNNETQFINYINICNKNPKVSFALWTKNYFIVKKVIEVLGYKKPTNLIIVLSSPYLNTQLDIKNYPLADKIFTVYTKAYIKKYNVDINCGAKNCLGCHQCYDKNGIVYINEVLK